MSKLIQKIKEISIFRKIIGITLVLIAIQTVVFFKLKQPGGDVASQVTVPTKNDPAFMTDKELEAFASGEEAKKLPQEKLPPINPQW